MQVAADAGVVEGGGGEDAGEGEEGGDLGGEGGGELAAEEKEDEEGCGLCEAEGEEDD